MNQLRFLSSLLIICIAYFAQAQNGTLRGVVYEEGNPGNKIAYATIKCLTAPGGGYTDFEGAFSFQLPAGIHEIEISYGLLKKVITDIEIIAGEVKFMEIPFSTTKTATKVIVRAAPQPNNQKAVDMKRINDVSFTDGLSGQQASRAAASDAAQMSQQIPGLSVQGGKYVFVRGLGDRYTKTILNGMVIPGLDPDRNTVQMDIFPSNILDNIIVYKTFTPNLPGDWAGGVVDISTRAFPITKTQNLGFTLGFNPAMHLNSNYITSEGGKLDWLAFDDGTRKLPISDQLNLTQDYDPALNKTELTDYTRSFNKQLEPIAQLNAPNFKMYYSLGDQINKGDTTLGYILSINYNRQTEFYDSVYYGAFVKPQSSEDTELLLDQDASGPLASQNVMWSVLGGYAYKVLNSSYSITALHVQNAETRAAELRQQNYRENPSLIFKDNIEYTQRSVSNIILAGKHVADSGRFVIDWKLSPTYSRIYEPDIKLTAFELTDDNPPRFVFRPSAGAVATRTYRYLNEWNYNARMDVEKKIEMKNGRETKLSVGFLETYKIRDFQILNYQFRVVQQDLFNWSGNSDDLLDPNNIWTVDPNGNDSGIYVSGNPEPANTFTAKQNVFGVYAMQELPVSNRLLFIYGVRLEKATNWYTGTNQQRTVIYNNTKLLDELNILPSFNVKYEVFKRKATEIMNVRLSYSRTLARPSFKELSNAQIVDRISGRTFIGNDSLVQSEIENIDLRWEYFAKLGQMVSVSAFYKRFTNPIELVAYSPTTPNDFQPRNVGNATLYGVELELRKRINFLTDTSYITSLGVNTTLVYSSVEMTTAERNGRILAARGGQQIGTHRDMVGQSPYIFNAYINFSTFDSTAWDFTLTYNVQGPRLAIVGVARNPDVYEMPFHNLIFRGAVSWNDNKYQLSLSAKNLLNSTKYMVYRSYESSDKMFSWMLPRQQFSVGFRYTLD